MKKVEGDILQYLSEHAMDSQRGLAEALGYSLGSVNQAINGLQESGMVNLSGVLTQEGREWLQERSPRRAIILAAGTGMRMIPINMEVSKGMLEVRGEPLVERQIRQLLEVGVREIYVVVGFMKEQYEYLMDKYGVELLVNRDYEWKNNLHSLAKAAAYLGNAYVVPCDIWCRVNPFHRHEAYSWYLVAEESRRSDVALNRKGELMRTKPGEAGNRMVGIAYLDGEAGRVVRERLLMLDADGRHDDCFWEESLYEKQKMLVLGKVGAAEDFHEINTYEQLRQLDSHSSQLDTEALRVAAATFGVSQKEIADIRILKKGMTNRSFVFSCKGKQYIMRIPGEGSEQLIDRRREYDVYQAIREQQLSDEVVYLNPENGFKITEFLGNARNCDPDNPDEVRRCIQFLRHFHEMRLTVPHSFDLFEQLEFYESLWDGKPSIYRDYALTKEHVLSLKSYIDRQEKDWVLTHVDAQVDNFLLCGDEIRLIDWEYAGMQDPHLDIAMFAIYSMYRREQVEWLIDAYFPEGCPLAVRRKIYCYIAVAGLVWSNWCEYKRQLGVEFGEYSLRQYRYAKEYYRIFEESGEKS